MQLRCSPTRTELCFSWKLRGGALPPHIFRATLHHAEIAPPGTAVIAVRGKRARRDLSCTCERPLSPPSVPCLSNSLMSPTDGSRAALKDIKRRRHNKAARRGRRRVTASARLPLLKPGTPACFIPRHPSLHPSLLRNSPPHIESHPEALSRCFNPPQHLVHRFNHFPSLLRRGSRGRKIFTPVPHPPSSFSLLATSRSPPKERMVSLAIPSPRPVPGISHCRACLPRYPRSKTYGRSSASIPGPLSTTSITTPLGNQPRPGRPRTTESSGELGTSHTT